MSPSENKVIIIIIIIIDLNVTYCSKCCEILLYTIQCTVLAIHEIYSNIPGNASCDMLMKINSKVYYTHYLC